MNLPAAATAAALVGPALAGLAAGVLLGLAHFLSLRWNTRLYVEGGAARAVALQVLRLALLTGVFFALARLGAAALLCGLLGLLAARRLVMRRLGGLP